MPDPKRDQVELQDQMTPDAQRLARYGLWLFALYLVLYGGFVFANAFAPSWMELDVFFGINLAVSYGLGLIAAALVLALIYSWLCRNSRSDRGEEESR